MFTAILMAITIALLISIMAWFKEDLTESATVIICCGLAFAGIILGGFREIPGTDATRLDISLMIQECEVSLPRDQNCVIDIGVRPEEK